MTYTIKNIATGVTETIEAILEDKATYVVARPVPPAYDLGIRVFDKGTFEVAPVQ